MPGDILGNVESFGFRRIRFVRIIVLHVGFLRFLSGFPVRKYIILFSVLQTLFRKK